MQVGGTFLNFNCPFPLNHLDLGEKKRSVKNQQPSVIPRRRKRGANFPAGFARGITSLRLFFSLLSGVKISAHHFLPLFLSHRPVVSRTHRQSSFAFQKRCAPDNFFLPFLSSRSRFRRGYVNPREKRETVPTVLCASSSL